MVGFAVKGFLELHQAPYVTEMINEADVPVRHIFPFMWQNWQIANYC